MKKAVKQSSEETNLRKELKEAEAKVRELEYQVESWKQRHAGAVVHFRERFGPLRPYYEPCPDIAVGATVLGNRVYGRVTWVGKGGGVWNGQELCRVYGYADVMPTSDLEVVS